jgi:hypothetical protein
MFEFNDAENRKAILACTNLGELMGCIGHFLDYKRVDKVFESKEVDGVRVQGMKLHEWSGHFDGDLEKYVKEEYVTGIKGIRAFEFLLHHLQALAREPIGPDVFKGTVPGVVNPVQRMYIYTNIIEPLNMNNKSVRLLKMVNTRGEFFKTTQEDFIRPMYVPVENGKISIIEVLIADESGHPVPFQIGTVVLTLHFRKVPRFGRR